ncbi:MAG: hypothetical protein GVY35_02095 [Bacteroidetes bacterium]|nr:hypothetical protein [Bacteroidota bacterium]
MTDTPRVVLGVAAAWLTATLLLMGCDLEGIGGTNPGPGPASQTDILDVRVAPNPVAVGDTAVFTCVIADSTDERFEFRWAFSAGPENGAVTMDNTYLWKAPNEPGEYRHRVGADNGTDAAPPSRSFTVTVVDTSDGSS